MTDSMIRERKKKAKQSIDNMNSRINEILNEKRQTFSLQHSETMKHMKEKEDIARQVSIPTIVYPNYKYDERLCIDRECDYPDKTMYYGVGYNQHSDDGTKHYRKYVNEELENGTIYLPKLPFDVFDIKRGQSRGVKSSLFSFSKPTTDATGNVSTVKTVGKFKGIINMLN